MKYAQLFLFAHLAAMTSWVNGYELATHGAITYQAYLKSNLNNNTLLQNLGIDVLLTSPGTAKNPFGDAYYDVQGGTIYERKKNDFEGDIIKEDLKKVLTVDPLTLPGWLMRGAIREDDLGTTLGFNVGKDPHDDPYGKIFRVFNHFYDPISGQPLTILNSAQGETAPNWALGTTAAFTSPIAENTSRRNHFTVFDAREAMYRALTGKTKDGLDAGPNVTPATESIRKTYWATTFRALGDIVHLNQDMAQPQHTRNESHGLTARYEKYIGLYATTVATYSLDERGTS